MEAPVVSLITYNFESELYSHTLLLCYQCTDAINCLVTDCGFNEITNNFDTLDAQCVVCTVNAVANTVVCATNIHEPGCRKYYYLLF